MIAFEHSHLLPFVRRYFEAISISHINLHLLSFQYMPYCYFILYFHLISLPQTLYQVMPNYHCDLIPILYFFVFFVAI